MMFKDLNMEDLLDILFGLDLLKECYFGILWNDVLFFI